MVILTRTFRAAVLAAVFASSAWSASVCAAGSFFDVFTELMVDGQLHYRSIGPTQYQGTPATLVSMDMVSSADPQVVVYPPNPAGRFQVDSFFDITYRIDPTGHGIESEFVTDSFFDVFTELSVNPLSPYPAFPDVGVFDTEMITLDLAGASSGPTSPYALQLLAGPPTRGHVTVLKVSDLGGSGEDGFAVDSVFHLLMKLSVDGGPPAQCAIPTHLRFQEFVSSTPEPSSLALLGAGLFGLLGFGRRRREH